MKRKITELTLEQTILMFGRFIMLTLLGTMCYQAKASGDTEGNTKCDSVRTTIEIVEGELPPEGYRVGPKGIRPTLKVINVNLNLGDSFEILHDGAIYPFNSKNSALSESTGSFAARIADKSKEVEIYPDIPFYYQLKANRKLSKPKILEYIATRARNNLRWGKRRTWINEQEISDILELIKEHPKALAQECFNADELYSIPLNFSREVLGDGFYFGKTYFVVKDGRLLILFMMSSKKGGLNFEDYLKQKKGLFMFE